MIKKIFFGFVGVLLICGVAFAKPSIPVMVYPTAEEQQKMLNEADDLIDDMADGQQDRQADAIFHALRGMGGELASLRGIINSVSDSFSGVERKDIKGEGNLRGISMSLYTPVKKSKGKLPLLVYFHGGGWTWGSVNSCSDFCNALASTGNALVLSVGYRLAPENPYPGGLEDCEAALAYAFAHAEEWGSDLNMVSVGGDSTGGNLALATALNLVKSGESGKKLRSVVLYYPVLKAYNDKSASWKEYSRGYGLDGRLMEAFCEAYLSGGEKGSDISRQPLVSPANASDAELKLLPPILLISPERDILFDQGKEFALRLKKLGKTVERVEFPGAIHTFVTVKGQPTAFRKALDLTEIFLND